MEIRFSKHRIEALSDGLFAIVMTLLVLELKVPELHRPVANEQLIEKLQELVPNLAIFALTFLLSSAFWFLHHSSLQPIRYMNRFLIWLNLIFLMGVSLLPFSAGLLGRYIHLQSAQAIYYVNQFIIGAMLVVQWIYARRKSLIDEDHSPELVARLDYRLWIIPVGSAGAMIGSFIAPIYAGYGFLIAVALIRALTVRKERAAVARARHPRSLESRASV